LLDERLDQLRLIAALAQLFPKLTAGKVAARQERNGSPLGRRGIL
jgi:hypothetical protein